jgi:hypothetical protein
VTVLDVESGSCPNCGQRAVTRVLMPMLPVFFTTTSALTV